MFGYVKPQPAELLVKEHEFYRATYCGVCRAMKKHTGALSNMLHSYDSVFLALVRMLYVEDDKISAKLGACIAHPFKKRPMLNPNEALEYTARAFGILTYYKISDDRADESFRKKLAATLINPIFSSAKRRAGLPELGDIIKDRLDKITALEKEKSESVDMPAGLFGELLGEIFAYGFEGSDRTVLYATGYHLGKFIYAADAADDYEKDRRSGSYNPYCIKYGNKELTSENRASIKCALLLECRALEGAVNLLPFGEHIIIENIIRNIIYLGLPARISFLDDNTDNGNKSDTDKQDTNREDIEEERKQEDD